MFPSQDDKFVPVPAPGSEQSKQGTTVRTVQYSMYVEKVTKNALYARVMADLRTPRLQGVKKKICEGLSLYLLG